MKSRKLISLVLSLAMVLSLVTVPAFAADAGATAPISAAKSFPDTVDHWAEKAIGRWAGYGVVKGDEAGKFNPDADLTRASLATILADFLKLSTKAKNGYSDVPADAWYADAVLKCTAAGILKGSEGLAKPGDNVSRQEAMVMIGRALGVTPAAKADLAGFTDGATVADWAAGYVTALTQSKIVAGVGENQVAPLVNINRASILSILDKAVSDYIAAPGTYDKVLGTGIVAIVVPDVVLKGNKIAGSLLVAEGVGDGNLTLDGTNVAGRTTVRGGGVNSFVIKGGSKLGDVTIARVDGAVRIVTSGGSTIETTYIDDGKDDVIMEGSFGNVSVAGAVPVTLKGADVKTVTATGKNADITVDAKSKVVTVATAQENTKITVAGTVTNVAATAEAKGVALNVSKGGTATSVTTAATGSVIKNNGNLGALAIAKGADTVFAKGESATKTNITAADKTDLGVTTIAAQDAKEAVAKAASDQLAAEQAAAKAAADKAAAEKLTADAKSEAEKAAAAKAQAEAAAKEAAAKAAADKAAADKAAADKAQADSKKEEDKVKEETKVEEKPVDPPKVDADKPGEIVVPKPVEPDKPKPQPEPEYDPYTYVSTPEALTAALANPSVSYISISGTIGSAEAYGVYTVDRAVTIKGGSVYGSFVVKVDGVTFNGVTISNKGDNAGGVHRNGINAYCKTLTIQNCIFNSGSEFANGVVIFPSDTSVTYTITGNTFNGYVRNSGVWNTAGLLITDEFALSGKAFFGEEIAAQSAKKATISSDAELAFMSGNTYTGCSMSYRHSSWTAGNTVNKGIATYINNTGLTTLPDISTGGKYYVGASMTIANETVPAGAELIINTGKTLTVTGTLTNNGTIANNGTIVVNNVAALKMAMNANTDIGTVKLGSDITVAKTDCLAENNWALVESFHGTLDGNNKQLISTVTANVTLAGHARGTAAFKNINLVQNGTNVLILAYLNHGSLAFNNVDVTRSADGSVECGNNESSYVGINYADVDFTDCESAVNYVDTAKTQHAAIFIGGYTYALDGKPHHATFTNCTNSGNMTGKDVALFVGNDTYTAERPITQTITVANCSNTGIFLGAYSSAPFANNSKGNVFSAVNLEGLTGKDETKFMTVANTVTGVIDSTTKAISVSSISGGAVAKYYTTLSVYGIDETSGTYMITISVPQAATGATGLYQAKFITKTAFEALNTGATKVENGIPAGTVITDNFTVALYEKDNVRYYVFDSVTHDTRTYSFGANGTLPTVSFYAYDAGENLIGYGTAK